MRGMCCSTRAAVFFFATLHLYFSVVQMVSILPTAISSLSTRTLEGLMSTIFTLAFFSSGFMTFRGADEESRVLIGLGGVVILVNQLQRAILLYFDFLFERGTLPEGDFLSPYGTGLRFSFILSLYAVYLLVLFCYHKELELDDVSPYYSPRPGSHSHEQFLSTLSRSLP